MRLSMKAGYLRSICVLLCMATAGFSQQFLVPAVNRVKLKIDTTWKFNLGDVTNGQTTTYGDGAWTTVNLPHSARLLTSIDGGNGVYRGICWYRKHFTLKSQYAGRRVTLFFEGAPTVAQVWINGNALPTHYGGYNPFCHEISQYCNVPGADNVIAVRLDNTYQNEVPPEKPDNSWLDYCIFGGLYRDVYLIITDNVYIPEAVHDWNNGFALQGGQFITYTGVGSAAATVNIQTWVKNTSGTAAACRLVTTLVDSQGIAVQSVETSASVATAGVTKFTQAMTVANPHLWFPYGLPYRYTLYTVVYNGATPVDLYHTKIGIRQLTWTKTSGFYCNGQAIKILGLNRTQQWPYVGSAVPNIQQVRDAVILKNGGVNFIRCSHYLQDDAFLNACDSLGILVWLEVPSWSSGFTPLVTYQPWCSRVEEAIRSNIRHARNHPSVSVWGGVNEAWQDVTFDDTLQVVFHQEDTTRPSTQSRNYNTSNNVYDLYGGNFFTPDMIPNSDPDSRTCGLLISEHTGHTYPTARTDAETRLDTHELKHEIMTQNARQRAWIHGNVGWCAFDYNSGDDAGVQNHGVMDVMHIPKFCYYFYQSQSAADNYDGSRHPMVFIANFYMSSSPADRMVLTNCDSVRLFRNGTYYATQVPAISASSAAHPSLNFTNVAFAAGNLRADGYIGGVVAASHTVNTPGTASKIVLSADPDTIEANGSDFSRIIAQVVDNNGTVIPTSTNSVSFSLSGSGTLIGQNPIAAERGQTIILAQAMLSAGTITVSASSGSLSSASVPVVMRPMAPDEDWTAVKAVSSVSAGGSYSSAWVGKIAAAATRILLPAVALAGKKSVAVYTLSGACVLKGPVTSRIIDLCKKGISANKIYIVKVEDVRNQAGANR